MKPFFNFENIIIIVLVLIFAFSGLSRQYGETISPQNLNFCMTSLFVGLVLLGIYKLFNHISK